MTETSPTPGRRLGWMMLVLLAFAAGAILTRLLWVPEPVTEPEAGRPHTPTPVPPTLRPAHTPTARAPDAVPQGGAAFPTLYLDIAPDDFAKIQAKRKEALENWILVTSGDDFVPATIRLGEQAPMSAEIRLKGDWGDHFAHDKWSYRVEIRDGGAIFGMRVFSLQDPSTRAYLNEWLFLENVRHEDILAVRYRFVHVVQNGAPMGIYAVEEGFSKELVESQARREGVIVRYNEDLLWEYWAAYENDLATPRGVQRFYIIDEFDSGNVADNPGLSAQREAAVGKLRSWWRQELATSEVFDVEKLARFWALVDLWGAQHAVRWHNLRFYYNPVTTLLEPIAFDTQPLGKGGEVDAMSLPGLAQVQRYEDPELRRAYVEALWAFSQSDYHSDLQARYGSELEQLTTALSGEFGDQMITEGALEGQGALTSPWDVLAQRQAGLRELLTPIQMTYVYLPAEVMTGTLRLDIGNILDFPVELVELQVGERQLPVRREWIASSGGDGEAGQVVPSSETSDRVVLRALDMDARFVDYLRLEIPVDETLVDVTGDTMPPLQLKTALWGTPHVVTQTVLSDYPLPTSGPMPAAPGLDTFLEAYPEFHVVQADRILSLPAATWTFSSSLLLPEDYGLRLEPGTTLRFEDDAYLLARGPLVFSGTRTSPVVLEPANASWPGVLVLDAGAPSYWDHVTVRDTVGFSVPGWSLTGGITFYESPISFSHVRLLGTEAEDALNVIRTSFRLVDSEFADTASDALDVDFGQGEVIRTAFHDIGADGVDVSGSHVDLESVSLQRLGDKGVSVGEASQLTAYDLLVRSSAFGVVSKDLSQTVIDDSTIEAPRIAALAAYVKKPEYGPASITARNITMVGVPESRVTLVETGSWIDLEGRRIWGTDVDVDALYDDALP
ncbi:MAG: CotH kinase family protein [Anaerolineae bacterium]